MCSIECKFDICKDAFRSTMCEEEVQCINVDIHACEMALIEINIEEFATKHLRRMLPLNHYCNELPV